MPSYTLPELIAEMEPQHKRDQTLICDCTIGLTLYASQHAQADPASPKISEMRNLIENLVTYWGLDNSDPAVLQKAFLLPFDMQIEGAKTGEELKASASEFSSAVVYGLFRTCEDMSVSLGEDAADEILSISKQMEDIASEWDFDSDTLDRLTTMLEAKALHLGRPVPGMEMQ